jgi:predicted ATPase
MVGTTRADNTNRLLTEILAAATRKRTILVIEDAHWLDSASWALLEDIVAAVHPLMVVIALRPWSESVPPEYALRFELQDRRQDLV